MSCGLKKRRFRAGLVEANGRGARPASKRRPLVSQPSGSRSPPDPPAALNGQIVRAGPMLHVSAHCDGSSRSNTGPVSDAQPRELPIHHFGIKASTFNAAQGLSQRTGCHRCCAWDPPVVTY